MKSNKPKYYRVRTGGDTLIMPGLEISGLQLSGVKVKILRKATIDEIKEYES